MSKITIITVCYNPPIDALLRTVNSVIDNIRCVADCEYIIVDGDSSNSALKYLTDIDNKNPDVDIKIISEPDHGIYDAMNKGVFHSAGSWLLFMNVGDFFYNRDVLRNCSAYLSKEYTIVYGDMFQNGKIVKACNHSCLKYGIIMACHQSMFFNKEMLGAELIYDLSYPIYADYELVVRINNKRPKSMLYVDMIISNYEGGGVSDKITTQKRIDKYKAVFKYYGIYGVLLSLSHWLKSRIYQKFLPKGEKI